MSQARCVSSCLPITALSSISFAKRHVVLSGKGSYIECLAPGTGIPKATFQALCSQSIHGITVLRHSEHDDQCEGDIFVYGGRHIAWLRLIIDASGALSLFRVHLTSVPDWILCSKPGSEGSGFVVLLTSYNAFYRADLNTSNKEIDLQCLNSTLSTFLYSADILQADPSTFIIASGTAFGEILTWICKLDSTKHVWLAYAWRDLRFHKGSIFGLCISQTFTPCTGSSRRLLASCSDDRRIVIWDITDITENAVLVYDQPKDTVTSALFTPSERCLASTWAHLSRIWSVSFSPGTGHHAGSHQLLVSTAEDGQTQAWRLVVEDDRGTLVNVHADRHHAGKNVWSNHLYGESLRQTLLSGGADGRIAVRSYNDDGTVNAKQRTLACNFKQMLFQPPASGLSDGHFSSGNIVLKTYIVLQNGKIAAATDRGLLVIFDQYGSGDWQIVFEGSSNYTHLILSARASHHRIVFGDSQNGTIYIFNMQKHSTRRIWQYNSHKLAWINIVWSRSPPESKTFTACIVVKCHGAETLTLLWLEEGEESSSVRETLVYLPDSFDVTSAAYDDQKEVLVCGTRSGAIALWPTLSSHVAEVNYTVCRRHVHGSDTVTSIQKVTDNYFVTTGRDGRYCILQIGGRSTQATDSTPTIDVVHRGTPPLGPNIEGAELIGRHGEDLQLVLYGFRSTQFVAWNETSQTQSMSVECGGAHRSWAFACHDLEVGGGTFVWTKAGKFMFHDQGKSDHMILRHGGHGREIKALAVQHLGTDKFLVATGSEDTDIRLFEHCANAKMGVDLRNVTIIQQHTTGLQDLMFLGNGKTLISAGGMEELFAWKLSEIPVIGQGVVLAATMPREDAQSDSRIMAIASKTDERTSASNAFIIAAALSNGQVRIMQYYASTHSLGESDAAFTTLQQIDFGTLCLTQAHLPTHRNMLLTGATNGSVTSCPLTISLAHVMTPLQSKPETSLLLHKVQQQTHQNSITAMQCFTLLSGYDLIMTGGDDNAIALTMIAYQQHKTDAMNDTRQTIVIPKAHSAAITALKAIHIQPQRKHSNAPVIMLFTAANDQKINIWSITFDEVWYGAISDRGGSNTATEPKGVSSNNLDHVHVSLVDEVCTNVADISGIDVLQNQLDAEHRLVARLLVVGVGMEVLEVTVSM